MDYDAEGKEVLKCGFKIGGGIDQNYKKSPQGYTDNVNLLNQSKLNYFYIKYFSFEIYIFMQIGHLCY